MQHRQRTERFKIPSYHYIEFSRYTAPVDVVHKPAPQQQQICTKAFQRNLRCYVPNNGLTLEQLPIERPSYSVDWSHVEFVDLHVSKDDPVVCPICLEDDLLVPRIAPCSHAFCWICILKYLNFSSADRKPCPLCQTCIEKAALKPVRFQIKCKASTVTMALLAQEEFSLSVSLHPRITNLLCGSTEMRQRNHIPHYDALDVQFWDIAYGHDGELQRMLNRDYRILEKLARDASIDGETCIAVAEALEQLNNLVEISDQELNYSDDPKNVQDAIANLKCLAQNIDLHNVANVLITPSTARSRRKFFCFYQSIDGRKLLLHPSLLKLLWRLHQGNVNVLPLFLVDLPISSLHEVLVTPESRRRIKFLHHFRLGTRVQLVKAPLERYFPKEECNGNCQTHTVTSVYNNNENENV